METMKKKNNLVLLLSGVVFGALSFTSLAQAAIIYDGAETSGVTTDDQYIIDYDDTSTTNISLEFGSTGTTYLRFNTVDNKFEYSHNIDLQSNQLLNARVQNVSGLPDVPACNGAADAGKLIFVTNTFVNLIPAQTLTADNYYICNSAGSLWLNIPTNFSSGDYLRSNANTTYIGNGLGDNTISFGDATHNVNVDFTSYATVNLE